MIKVLYHEERRWSAFKHSNIPLALELLKGPNGYSVHICANDKPRSQHLTLEQARTMYRDLSERLWGERVDPIINDDFEPVPSEDELKKAWGL